MSIAYYEKQKARIPMIDFLKKFDVLLVLYEKKYFLKHDYIDKQSLTMSLLVRKKIIIYM